MRRIKEGKDGSLHYFDKNGVEIYNGSFVRTSDGKVQRVYLTDKGYLGTDATNPSWILSGRAYECEYGIYPLEERDLEDMVNCYPFTTVQMGLNTSPSDKNWDDLVEKFADIVEKDGIAQASWSCTGRTLHYNLARQLREELTSHKFFWDIDYDMYRCIAYKK